MDEVNVAVIAPILGRDLSFVPYGPARAGAEALSRIMAADLAGSPVTVNLLLPGGATLTGMIPAAASFMIMGHRWLHAPPTTHDHGRRAFLPSAF